MPRADEGSSAATAAAIRMMRAAMIGNHRDRYDQGPNTAALRAERGVSHFARIHLTASSYPGWRIVAGGIRIPALHGNGQRDSLVTTGRQRELSIGQRGLPPNLLA